MNVIINVCFTLLLGEVLVDQLSDFVLSHVSGYLRMVLDSEDLRSKVNMRWDPKLFDTVDYPIRIAGMRAGIPSPILAISCKNSRSFALAAIIVSKKLLLNGLSGILSSRAKKITTNASSCGL
jgi:hypothetical protein